jgi:hypothetical protein
MGFDLRFGCVFPLGAGCILRRAYHRLSEWRRLQSVPSTRCALLIHACRGVGRREAERSSGASPATAEPPLRRPAAARASEIEKSEPMFKRRALSRYS